MVDKKRSKEPSSEIDEPDEITVRIERKGKRPLNYHIPKERIFCLPNLKKDNPLIFWIFHRKLKPATTIFSNPPIVIMNLWSLRDYKETDEGQFKHLCHYISAVMVEELSHCSTRQLEGHDKWIFYLQELQRDLDEQ